MQIARDASYMICPRAHLATILVVHEVFLLLASPRYHTGHHQRLTAHRTAPVSAIQRSDGTAERPLHMEPLDAQLDSQAAVTERAARRLRQKVAESAVQVCGKSVPRRGHCVYESFAIR